MLRTLIALTVARPRTPMPTLPPYATYQLKNGHELVHSELYECAKLRPKEYDFAKTSIEREIDSQSKLLAHHYTNQWPCETPKAPLDRTKYNRLCLTPIIQYVEATFVNRYRSYCLYSVIAGVQVTLNDIQGQSAVPSTKVPQIIDTPQLKRDIVGSTSLLELFTCNAPSTTLASKPPPSVLIKQRLKMAVRSRSVSESALLATLLNELEKSENAIERSYGRNLRTSQAQYLGGEELVTPSEYPWDATILSQNVTNWKVNLDDAQTALIEALRSSQGDIGGIALLAGQAPSITPVSILTILGGPHFVELAASWQEAVLKYGYALVQYQRAARLQSLMSQDQRLAFYRESEHGGQDEWSARQYPFWLALEADNDFMIRPVQARVALKMLSSEECVNSVLQLNMGDGKSSVIMPMVVLALSDGTRLARAVVLDSLARPMRYILRRTIGRILQRPILSLPFSRNTLCRSSSSASPIVSSMETLQQQCLHSRGVLLAQPEHTLPFELIGVERLWAKEKTLSSTIFHANAATRSICCDIIDECDAILVDNQLIYTVGSQDDVQGGSERWKVIQDLLSMAMAHAEKCQSQFPQQVELFSDGPGTFPHLRMSAKKAGMFLAAQIAEELKQDKLLNTRYLTWLLTPSLRYFLLSRIVRLHLRP